MDELNELAARVWQRVARGEAYDIKQDPKPGPRPRSQPRPNSILPMLLLLVLVKLYRL